MKNRIRTKLLILLVLAGTPVFADERFFGAANGGYDDGYYNPPPPPPPAAYYSRPPCPGPDYSWIDGYWYPAGPRYAWRAGYWTRPPYARAHWVAPRYHERRYYRGYWRR